jgi:hypothetical protein
MILLAATACTADEVFPVVHNEPITVRVLDGVDGKPQPYAHVVLLAGYDRRDLDLGLWRKEAVTDGAGAVQLSNLFRNLPLVRVEVLKRHGCAPDAGDAAFSVELIRRDGLSGANRCGTTTVEDAPGVLTVFVKGKKGTAPAKVWSAPPGIAAALQPDPAVTSILASAPAACSVPVTVPLPAPVPAPAPGSREPAAPVSEPKDRHSDRGAAGPAPAPAPALLPVAPLAPAASPSVLPAPAPDDDAVGLLCVPVSR